MHIIDSDKIMYHGLKEYSEEYRKGYLEAMGAADETPSIISDIQKLSPQPTETITLFYDMENATLKEIKDIFDSIKINFPENKVIAIPNKTSLESCSKDVLENIISMITEIIEEL